MRPDGDDDDGMDVTNEIRRKEAAEEAARRERERLIEAERREREELERRRRERGD
jgi:hypothetical protein